MYPERVFLFLVSESIVMKHLKKGIVWLANSSHHLTSLLLIVAALGLLYTAMRDMYIELHTDMGGLWLKIVENVSLIVVAIAIFDVVKYVIEEAATDEIENKTPAEARSTLTKFIVILFVAISLETLVTIFFASKPSGDIANLIYPSILLFSVTLLIVWFGFYQKMSVDVEEKEMKMRDKCDEQNDV